MYGIFTYIWLICMVNVGKYTIHGWYGRGVILLIEIFRFASWVLGNNIRHVLPNGGGLMVMNPMVESPKSHLKNKHSE